MKFSTLALALVFCGLALPAQAVDVTAATGAPTLSNPPAGQAATSPEAAEKSCAAKAASPREPGFEKSSIEIDKIDMRPAFAACTAAVEQNPGSRASRFRLGRVEIAINAMDKAIADITVAAEAGYLPAMGELASLYTRGVYYPVDAARAVSWLTRAVSAGDNMATRQLADFYERGIGVASDYRIAIGLLKPIADKGDINAAEELGLAYQCRCEDGHEAEEVRYFRVAAEAGLASAQRSLAAILSRRDSPFYNAQDALLWYQRAAAQKLPVALVELGEAYANPDTFVPTNFALAEGYFADAVALGSQDAVAGLGRVYFYGGDGVPQDRAKAAGYFETAVNAGNVTAEEMLGGMMMDGDGIAADPQQGLALLSAAVQQGSVNAMLTLAHEYRQGMGIPHNISSAIALYQLAAAQGSAPAMDELGDLYQMGDFRFGADAHLARYWYQQAAGLGDARAQTAIGSMALSDSDQPANLATARVLLENAAKAGDITADEQLGEMYEAGTGVAPDIATAIRYYTLASDAGLPMAQYRLGALYVGEKAELARGAEGARLLAAAAQFGYGPAALTLAQAYESGLVLTKDEDKALAAYVEGCSLFDREACLHAGQLQLARSDLAAARESLGMAAVAPDSTIAAQAAKALAALPPTGIAPGPKPAE